MNAPIRPGGHTWADLIAPDEIDPEEMRVDADFYRVFTTPEGQRALAHMHALTTFKRNLPNASDGALREAEAQRRFVAIIEARISRYMNRNKDGGRTNSESGTSGGRQRRRRNAP